MKDLFALWGCGDGLLKSLQPPIRIMAGVLIGATCLLIPLRAAKGVSFLLVVSFCWVFSAAMPQKVIFRCAAASIILFFPFLLLSPWMTGETVTALPIIGHTMQAARIALRSTCMLFVAAATIASLTLHDVHCGLVYLPVPRSLVMLIVQLIFQTMLLTEETTRIIGVLRLRSASGVHGMRVFFSFPVVWMVRMLFRAERTASAMAVRGYGVEATLKVEKLRLTTADLLTIFVAGLLLTVSVVMRIKGLQ